MFQKIFNVWSKSHMCLGCLFWKQWEKCTSLILQSIILNFGKHFLYVLNLITSCGNTITNFVKMSIWIISIVLNLPNFSKYFQLWLTAYKCYFKHILNVKTWYKLCKAVLKPFFVGLNLFCNTNFSKQVQNYLMLRYFGKPFTVAKVRPLTFRAAMVDFWQARQS